MKIKTTITYFIIPFLFIFQGEILKSQTFEEMDYVVLNRLYDFLIDYEESLNAEAFAKSETIKFFYDDDIEVYNDLDKNSPEYLPVYQYLNIYDTMKSGKPEFEVFHYNLRMIKNQTRLYFDLIHIELLKDVVDNSIYPDGEVLHIDSANIIESNLFNFTIIYNKFDPDNRFKILKIERSGQSYLPSAWHRKEIPDEIKVSFGPMFTGIDGNAANSNVSYKDKFGFQAKVMVMNRFAGGEKYAFSWFAGLGARIINSEWSMQSDTSLQLEPNENNIRTQVLSQDINQELSLFYCDIPLGVSFRYFPVKKMSFLINAELKPWMLMNSNYSINEGRLNYSGYETYAGQEFHYVDMENPYGFIDFDAVKNNTGVNMSSFGVNAGFSLQLNYRISNYFDIFIQPSWETSITDLLDGNSNTNLYSYDVPSRGEVNPLIEQLENPTLATTSLEVGVVFRLNNIVKSYIPEIRFIDKEQRDQKDNFYDYLVNRIPEKKYEKPFEKRKKSKISIHPQDDFVKYPGYIRYSYGPDLGIAKNELKIGKVNRIKAERSDIYMFKPFQFELASEASTNPYRVNHKVLYDSLVFSDSLKKVPVDITMNYLPDLNVFIVSKMNEGKKGVRALLINKYKNLVTKLGENMCALYFEESHGRTIKELYEKGNKTDYCFDCNNAFYSVDEIEKKVQDGAPTDFNFMNELRILLSKDFNLERRNINLHFLLGNDDSFTGLFEKLQMLSEANTIQTAVWTDPDDDLKTKNELNLLKQEFSNYTVDISQFKKIEFYFYSDMFEFDDQIISNIQHGLMVDYFKYLSQSVGNTKTYSRSKANTSKALYNYLKNEDFSKKSIRLRNFEFNAL